MHRGVLMPRPETVDAAQDSLWQFVLDNGVVIVDKVCISRHWFCGLLPGYVFAAAGTLLGIKLGGYVIIDDASCFKITKLPR